MWTDAGKDWGRLLANFVVCKAPSDEDAATQKKLDEEAGAFGDLLFADCEEGYLDGKLSQKVMASMQSYMSLNEDFELFMKVDDDTFFLPRRLCDLMQAQSASGKDISRMYMGVFTEDGVNISKYHQAKPCRDADSPWYEAPQKFNGDLYPISAQGGPGYILSKQMVSHIIRDGIAKANLLNMEDKAVGLWVDKLIHGGMHVEFLNIPGTNGYDEWNDYVQTGTLADYPYILHHHLDGDMIACLHGVAKSGDHGRKIDGCFHAREKEPPLPKCNDGIERR